MTQAEVDAIVLKIDADKRSAVVCALIGHSSVQTACFGYFNCGRCGAQTGDTIGSSYPGAAQAVVIDHHCDTCRANAQTLTWADTYLLPATTVTYLAVLADVKKSRRVAATAERKYQKARASFEKRSQARERA